ncbi:19108_t:CDS:1 [Entrophospora sp. SA101]|nr:10742_t:CDS:1 [Entrophospora sp. SA101]CAJ0763069.1 19108_t:CDS:1 [Entrophospora sp. SA101]CAJ0829009.1 21917_t:CDS:1 [Entrophospora sp. SA101]CAJ0829598.1 5310_t:CDS:1 [Entrophospora sp. SA101]
MNNVNGIDYLDDLDNDEGEKYMTFLPHSGLHNQRIGFENAIFMAWFLNRTLVMPPALLGTRFQYIRIKQRIKYLKAESVDSICENIEYTSEKQKCKMFHNSYTLYPFDQLFNFTFARQHVKIMNVPDYNDNTVFKMLNITKRKEVYYSLTRNLNNKLYDTEAKSNIKKLKGNTFIKLQSLQELREHPEKLLYFGSLFGSSRIITNLQSSKYFLTTLRLSLVPIDPIMLSVVGSIAEKLGGAGEYISAHARGGDHTFKETREEHFAMLVKNIDENFPEASKYSTSLKTCPLSFTKPENNKNRIIYVASDLDKNDESMKIFLKEFPCLKMLSDFTDQLEPYQHFINPVDNKVMRNYLMPLTDLMVAANSLKVFAIKGSTYGVYMEKYNSILSMNI